LTRLREDAFKSPIYHIAIITLLGVGLVSLPIDYLFSIFIKDPFKARVIGGILLRMILSALAVFAIKKYGFSKPFTSGNGGKAFIMCIPALVVAVNNFPISALISGRITFIGEGVDVVLFVLYCLSVGLFEELVFCGLVFPLVLYVFKDKRYSVVWATAISAALFALSHLMNIFSGASVGATLLQVGYSFLIGAMCSICKCVTRNIFTAITLHTVYDIGGLILSDAVGIGRGNQWDTLTIVVTAIIGVLVAIYMIILVFKVDHNEFEELYFTEEIPR